MMSSFSFVRKNGTAWYDYLLVIGLILSPMTGLRIWKLGPSELLCTLWCLRYLRYLFKDRMGHYLVRFWLFFYLTITAGMLWCLLFYPSESSGLDGVITWLFMLILSLGVYAGLKQHSLKGIFQLLETICLGAAAWYIFLLIFSKTVSPTFLGAPLWYGGGKRFSGGGTNPHQMAILALGLVFASAYFLARVKLTGTKKLMHLACIVIEVYILILTRSTTALMALAAAGVLGMVLLFVQYSNAIRNRQTTAVFLAVLAVLALSFSFEKLYNTFMEWVSNDPNGLGRFELFSYIWDPLRKNFLFGLGDGTHSNNGISEFHNSYLEIIGMGGLIGVVIFVIFTIRLIKGLKKDPFLLMIPAALYVYGLAGFGLRRLPYWVLTSFMIAISEKLPDALALRAERWLDLRALAQVDAHHE
jgi:O-antigen ligase